MLLENIRYILTQNPDRDIRENVDVRVEGKLISEIGDLQRKEGEEVIDCSQKLVMPGLINCHTHVAMNIFKGISDDKNLHDWLHEDIFPAEEEMTDQDVYQGAKMGIEEMLRTGTTCFNDMYAPEGKVVEAVDETGIRAVLANGFVDIDGEGGDKLEKSQEFIENWKHHSRITPAVAPHAVYTCSDELLWEAKKQAEEYNTMLHIHLSETRKENADCIEENDQTPTQHLHKLELLSENTVCAHGTHLTGTDMELLAETGTGIAHNPCANLKLGAGVADTPEMIEKDVIVGLGTDGAASNNNLNMFEEAKFAALVQKERNPGSMKAQQVLDMMTCDAAEALSMENRIGSVEKGKRADIVTVDLDRPDMKPVDDAEDVVSHLIFSFNGEVSDVMVGGEILLRDQTLQ